MSMICSRSLASQVSTDSAGHPLHRITEKLHNHFPLALECDNVLVLQILSKL